MRNNKQHLFLLTFFVLSSIKADKKLDKYNRWARMRDSLLLKCAIKDSNYLSKIDSMRACIFIRFNKSFEASLILSS